MILIIVYYIAELVINFTELCVSFFVFNTPGADHYNIFSVAGMLERAGGS